MEVHQLQHTYHLVEGVYNEGRVFAMGGGCLKWGEGVCNGGRVFAMGESTADVGRGCVRQLDTFFSILL